MQQTRADVFEEIFIVFLGLGTLVGIIVVAYMLYNAYKYRDGGDAAAKENLPTLGELPTGGTGGKKLFLSFGLSAIIVVSLIVWTYGMLLYVEDGPDGPGEDAVEIDVEGFAFGWEFGYQDGNVTSSDLVVPADTEIWLEVTSRDVWHAFGLTQERVKADAIPGETDETWFIADETGEYENAIECFELCGQGHSQMMADLRVLEEDEYQQWLQEQQQDTEAETLDPDETITFEGTTDGWEATGPDAIEGETNPALGLQVGETYEVTWENGDGLGHNFEIRDENDEVVEDYSTELMEEEGETQSLEFTVTEEMAEYVCNPHAGSMSGSIQIVDGDGDGTENGTDAGNGTDGSGDGNETNTTTDDGGDA